MSCLILEHEGWVQALCFSNDGYLLVSSADDEMVKIWNVHTGKCLKTLEGKTESSSHCAFHPSGALVASGSASTTLMLASKPLSVEHDGQSPHKLEGEEILDKQEVVSGSRPRAQSARPLRTTITDGTSSYNMHKVRPKTAVGGKTIDTGPMLLSNVERWLSSSYQRL